MRSALALLGAVSLLVAPAAAPAQDTEPKTNLADISDEVMCPVCGVPLELAQEAPQAEAEREFIRELIAQGATKDEIKAALVDEYGEDVLTLPGTDGFDLAAWLIPAAALLTAAIAIGIALRRWRPKTGSAEPLSEGSETPETTKSADAERLEADMARYEP